MKLPPCSQRFASYGRSFVLRVSGINIGGVGGVRVSGLWGLKALQGLGHTRAVRALKPQTAKNLGGPL